MAKKFLIIQFKSDCTHADFEWMMELDEVLHQGFQQNGSGVLDGHDCGSGTINFFVEVLGSWKAAIDVAQAYLKHRKLLDRALIVKQLPSGRNKVVWPPDFDGEFALM